MQLLKSPRWRLLAISPDGRLLIYERRSQQATLALLPASRQRGEIPTEIQASVHGFRWFPRVDCIGASDGSNTRAGPRILSLNADFRRCDGFNLYKVIADGRQLTPLEELILREETGETDH